jgi:aminoglycoside 6'-N-acetyltransferase I
MASDEAPAVLALIRAVWPARDRIALTDDIVFVLERDDGRIGGFLVASIRPWAEGCAGPVGFVEGWWVAPELRRRGAGAALMKAAEAWTWAQGLTELASGAAAADDAAVAAHRALGFAAVDRAVCFRKQV